MKLYSGNKNYSSWSIRAWLALRESGLPFEEEVIPLDTPAGIARIHSLSPSKRVPLLEDEGLFVWDSLAIAEYVAEKSGKGWPRDARARAIARSVSAEMHSGFPRVRELMSMDARARRPTPALDAAGEAQLHRIVELWTRCRSDFGAGGDFLFGEWSIADAFYAPIVSRFVTYGVSLEGEAASYKRAVLERPSVKEWLAAAQAEPWTIPAT